MASIAKDLPEARVISLLHNGYVNSLQSLIGNNAPRLGSAEVGRQRKLRNLRQ
jgi:predicted glutamine amidotransferase